MNDRRGSHRIARVTLALSGSGDAGELVELAGMLARAARAALHGLLLEDEALYDLAGLPFSVSVTPGHSLPNIPLTREALEREYEREERACRDILSAHSSRTAANWSFERRRGQLPDVLLSATRDELLLLRSDETIARTRSAFQEIVARRPGAAGLGFIGRRQTNLSGPILAICSGGVECSALLAFSRDLAVLTQKPLEIILLTESGDVAEGIEQRVMSVVGSHPVAHCHPLISATVEQLISSISRFSPSLIVGDLSAWPFSRPETAEDVIRSAHCPCIMLPCSRQDELVGH